MAAVELLTSLNLLLALVEVEVVGELVEVVVDVEVDSQAVLPFQQHPSRTAHLEESWEVSQTIQIHL